MMKFFEIESLRNLEQNREVIILGGAPIEHQSIKNAIKKTKTVICLNAINANLIKDFDLNLKYHLLSDYRFNFTKHEYLQDINDDTYCIWADYLESLQHLQPRGSFTSFRLLGYNGFSKNANIGFFSGYTVAHIALQLCYLLNPTKVNCIGVNLYYGIQNTRFYQKSRGNDVDLHVSGKQIENLRYGIQVLKGNNISVEFHGSNSLLRGKY